MHLQQSTQSRVHLAPTENAHICSTINQYVEPLPL